MPADRADLATDLPEDPELDPAPRDIADEARGLASAAGAPEGPVPGIPADSDETPDGAPRGIRALLQDGGSLSIAVGLSGALGAVGWVIAARVADPVTVGHASAIVSAMLFASSVGQASLSTALFRWLPVAGGRSRAFIGSVVLAVTLMSLLIALLLLPLVRQIGAAGPELALFVVATLAWAMFQLLGPLQAALGRARAVPLQDGSFSLVRLAMIPLLAGFGVVGIVGAWVLPALVFAAVIGAWLWRRLPPSGPGRLPSMRQLLRFTGGNWAGSLAQLVGWHIVPLIVTATAGPSLGAVFYVLWTVVSALELAVQQFGASMVVRSSTHPDGLAGDVRVAVRVVLGLAVPGLAVVALAASPLLGLFGAHYANVGVDALRLLALGLAGRTVTILAVATYQAMGRSYPALLAHTVQTLATLGGLVLAMTTGGGDVLATIAAGYAAGAWVSALVAGVALMRVARRRPTPSDRDADPRPDDRPDDRPDPRPDQTAGSVAGDPHPGGAER